MNIILERQPDCKATLRVEVPAEAVNRERKQITQLFAAQAKIPGFRPGKTPSSVIEKRYSKQIQDELKDRLIQQGCQEGIKKEELNVLAVTKVDETEFHLDDTFSFTAELQTAPEFEIPEYKNIPVELKKIEVTDHDIDHHLEHMRERMAEYKDVEGREIEMGDFIVFDFGAVLDGQPLIDVLPQAQQIAKGEDQWLKTAEETFLPGFCQELVGLKPGESKDFTLEIADDFAAEDLAGKKLDYHVEIKGIKEQVLPEWTDELTGKLEEGLTVEKLREQTREQMESRQEQERAEEMTTQVMEFLAKELEFQLPEHVVANEAQRQVNQIVQRGQMQGMTEEMFAEQEKDIIAHAQGQAEVNVKTGFILEEIAKKENIQATEQEILGHCAHLAETNNTPLKKYIKQLQKADQIGTIANRIVTSKTLDFLRENASVTEVDREPHDCDHDH